MELAAEVVALLNKGVEMTCPMAVEVSNEVNLERISGRHVCFIGSVRIQGSHTLICPGARLGEEGPVTLKNCYLGENVELRGGYFRDSVFLDGSVLGSGAQVREGCLIEEDAGGNHCIGLKQTVLFPFVTLGSLVNFCDCLMAGGTSRSNHSEVGSSYIHFNYTPHQDKATASLIGDVPQGVMLECAPIFLGGQGGIVGPVRIGYGTVLSAGTILREDCPEGGKLLSGPVSQQEREFYPGLYRNVRRKALNNIRYTANLLALKAWYVAVRSIFMQRREMGPDLLDGCLVTLDAQIKERIKRFREFCEKMEKSIVLSDRILPDRQWDTLRQQKKELLENYPAVEINFTEYKFNFWSEDKNRFLKDLNLTLDKRTQDYISVIKALDAETKAAGTRWLQSVVEGITEKILQNLPSLR